MISRIAFFFKDFLPYIIGLLVILALFVLLVAIVQKSIVSSKTKKIALGVGFFIVCFSLVFCMFEGYFRYIYDESDGLGFLQVNKRWTQRHVVYNNFFKRDRDFKAEKPAGIIRIGMLGDSI